MFRVVVFCIVLAGVAGCRDVPATNQELASAHETLKTGLEVWKNGGTPASLNSGATPLEFSDSDWQSGAKLLEYRLSKGGGEEDDETICAVHLKMEVRGKTVEKQMSYRVTLTPKRTVSRYSGK